MQVRYHSGYCRKSSTTTRSTGQSHQSWCQLVAPLLWIRDIQPPDLSPGCIKSNGEGVDGRPVALLCLEQRAHQVTITTLSLLFAPPEGELGGRAQRTPRGDFLLQEPRKIIVRRSTRGSGLSLHFFAAQEAAGKGGVTVLRPLLPPVRDLVQNRFFGAGGQR